MIEELKSAVADLDKAVIEFNEGRLKSVPFSDVRGECLARGLRALARHHGVELVEPLNINTLGEISLTAMPKDPDRRRRFGECGEFGDAFATILSGFQPRTGQAPRIGGLGGCSGWCHMNHFQVEAMLRAEVDKLAV